MRDDLVKTMATEIRTAFANGQDASDQLAVLSDLLEEEGMHEEANKIRASADASSLGSLLLRLSLGIVSVDDLIAEFDKARMDGSLKMEIHYDGGHAYNEWAGKVYHELSDLASDMFEDDQDQYDLWEEHENDTLSEDDPGTLCVPETINQLILADAGRTPGNDMVVADECADDRCESPEETADYLEEFMQQVEDYHGTPKDIAHAREWFRFDLMKRYVEAVRRGETPLLVPRG